MSPLEKKLQFAKVIGGAVYGILSLVLLYKIAIALG